MADTIADTATATASGKTGLTDSIRQAFAGDAPLADKAKAFYKARPVASVALAGIAGLTILNTLRGKR